MDRLRGFLLQLRDFFLALPPARRASFLLLTAAVVGGTAALTLWVQRPQYRVLFANLDATDGGAVVDYLKAEKIPYRVGEGTVFLLNGLSYVAVILALLAMRLPPQPTPSGRAGAAWQNLKEGVGYVRGGRPGVAVLRPRLTDQPERGCPPLVRHPLGKRRLQPDSSDRVPHHAPPKTP